MAVYAANCPCCGRDIGFDEGVKEYTCIFCGAKLITATLVKERLDGTNANAGYEHYRKGDISDAREPRERRIRRPAQVSGDSRQSEEWGTHVDAKREAHSHEEAQKHDKAPVNAAAQNAEAKKTEAHKAEASKEEAAKEPEHELTEEEIRVQLVRKAEFKQELREVVKEIDTLRARRDRYDGQKKSNKLLTGVGLTFVLAAGAVMIIFDGLGDDPRKFWLAGVLVVLGLALLTTAEIRKKTIKNNKKRHEELIAEKKEKRDVLIGRLNKINKRLHIHDDD